MKKVNVKFKSIKTQKDSLANGTWQVHVLLRVACDMQRAACTAMVIAC